MLKHVREPELRVNKVQRVQKSFKRLRGTSTGDYRLSEHFICLSHQRGLNNAETIR